MQVTLKFFKLLHLLEYMKLVQVTILSFNLENKNTHTHTHTYPWKIKHTKRPADDL